MVQVWHELLFIHWSVPLVQMRSLVPDLLQLDTFEGEAWLGIVPFRMSNVRPRGVPPVSGLASFPELNVRTYVVANGIPGVYFFSLDAGNPLAVVLARCFFHLPYFNATMSCKRERDRVCYCSQRTHRGAPLVDFRASHRPIAPVFTSQVDSLVYWLTERHALYTAFHRHLYRGDIHHAPWQLQLAELELSSNTMVNGQGIQLSAQQPLLHYAELQEVLIWPLRLVR
jgi:uncharacterized protein YqjF (DUF2071 family)